MAEQQEMECRLCGDAFNSRDDLIEHNVQVHEMTREESERRVNAAYGS